MADVRMLGPDGKEYDVPDDKVTEAISLGMKKQPRPVDPSPTKEFFKAGAEGLEGFAKGVVPGAVKAVPGMVKSLVTTGQEAAEGLYGLATDPVATLKKGGSAIADLPGQARAAVVAAADKARQDPEAFGRDVGEMTGGAATGIAAARMVPIISKPGAVRIGRTVEELGRRAKFPMQLAGASQLASGHPISGVATMLTPSAMQATGEGLTKLGGGTTVAADKAAAALAKKIEAGKAVDAAATGAREIDPATIPGASRAPIRVNAPSGRSTQPNTVSVQKGLPISGSPAAVPAPYRAAAKAADKADQLVVENKRRLKLIEDAAKGGEAGEPKIVESVSAETPEGGKKSMSVRIGTPKADAVKSEEDAIVANLKQRNPGMSDTVARDLAKRFIAGEGKQPAPGGIRVGPPSPKPAPKLEPTPSVAGQGQAAPELPESWKKLVNDADKGGASSLGDFMKQVDEALGKTPSGSKKGSGAWKSLSDNDASDAAAAYVSGERNPAAVAESILKNRKLRQQMHISNHYADRPAPKDEPKD